MAFDPLSHSTRRTRRSLLGVASSLVIVQAFNVALTDVPLVGLEISLGALFLPYLLLPTCFYLLVSFTLSVIDDVANLPKSELFRKFDDDCEDIKQKEINILRQEIRPILQQKMGSGDHTEVLVTTVIEAAGVLLPKNYTDEDFQRFIMPIVEERIPTKNRAPLILGLTDRLKEAREKIELSSEKKYPGNYSKFQKFRIQGLEAILPIIFAIAALCIYLFAEPGWGSRMFAPAAQNIEIWGKQLI